MKYAITILLIFFSSYSWATSIFNTEQEKTLLKAKIWGEYVGYPETIQSIILTESSANVLNTKYLVGDNRLGFGKRSYGIMQIKLSTAKFVIRYYGLHWYRDLPEEVLIAKLLVEKDFNLQIGALYFKYLIKRFKSWKHAVVAYNRGPGWVSRNRHKVNNHRYLTKVRYQLVRFVRPFNYKQ